MTDDEPSFSIESNFVARAAVDHSLVTRASIETRVCVVCVRFIQPSFGASAMVCELKIKMVKG